MGPYYDLISLMLWRLPEPSETPAEPCSKSVAARRSPRLGRKLLDFGQRALHGLAAIL